MDRRTEGEGRRGVPPPCCSVERKDGRVGGEEGQARVEVHRVEMDLEQQDGQGVRDLGLECF
jgi:hypothetical protein